MTRKTIDNLLELKKFKKDEIELQLKEILNLLRKEEEHLIILEELYKKNKDEYQNRITGNLLNIVEIESYTEYFSKLFEKISEQKKIINIRKKEVEEIKAALLEAHKDEKIFEKLLQKLDEQKRKMESAREQREIDYLYLSKLKKT